MRVNLKSRLWQCFFILAALEAGAAFVMLASVPGEGGGRSPARLGLLGLLALLLIAAGWALVRLPRVVGRLERSTYAMGGFALAFLAATLLFLLRYLAPDESLPYYHRLAPLLWYALAVSAEFAVCVLATRCGLWPRALRGETALWRASGAALAALLAVFAFVAITRLGLTPDSAYWAEPGVPVLGWQLGVILAGAAALFFLGGKLLRMRRGDTALAAALWLLAAVVWLSVPGSVMKNSFYGPINPPTNQSMPNSDAGYYDSMAQSLLIGYPYQGDIPTRPLYITVLAALHLLVGERYDLIVAGQTLVLALIPVVLFLLGNRLHSRSAGMIAALYAIFREWNSLLISSQTRVSNTKTLLVDLPTLLLLLAACLFAVRWLQRRGRLDALLAGGFMGLLLLLRTQTLLLLPAVLLVAICAYGIRNRAWVPAFALFFVGMAAALAPWLVHNYLQTGAVTLDAPFEYQVIASQYKYTGNLDLGTVDLQGKGVLGLLITFALKDPAFVLGFITSHFLATLTDSMLALPLLARYDGLNAPLNLYWMSWPAGIDPLNATLLVPYLGVIALGIGAAWKRARWAGLLPLACSLAYALANGIGRFSGWRYDLPADWVSYFYLAIGAAEAFRLFALLFGSDPGSEAMQAPAPRSSFDWRRAAAAVGLLVLVGGLPWLAEGIASPRYASTGLPELMNALDNSAAVRQLGVEQPQIKALVADPQATLQIGRVLYPRFFLRDKGMPSSHPWPAYAVRDFPRMGFLLLNQSRHEALMPINDSSARFTQGGDAIILGCQRQDYIEVRLILFPQTGQAYVNAPLPTSCE
jgi:hypothetical protein